MEQPHIFSASDLAQFEYCPLAWWYEEISEVAQADQEELTRHLEELENEYPSAATALPEYQVIERLIERAELFSLGKEQHAAHEAQPRVAQTDKKGQVAPVPRAFTLLVSGLILLTLVLLVLGLLLWFR
jgi:hypothetical protein